MSENTDLRNELASLRENEVYQTRIIELSKTELRDAVRSGETQQVRLGRRGWGVRGFGVLGRVSPCS